MTHPGHAERVWKGDPTTVREARERYQKDPGEGLIPFAVALYSFRHKREFARELILLVDKLVDRGKFLLDLRFPLHSLSKKQETADLMDTVSTHLEWISRQEAASLQDRERARELTFDLCNFGIGLARPGHTSALLVLTKARVNIEDGNLKQAVNGIFEAAARASYATDANQKARVYRKIGFLYRKCGRYTNAVRWGTKAIFVKGATKAVRLKSIAALLGAEG